MPCRDTLAPLVAILGFVAAESATADDFRIQSQVYLGATDEMLSRNLTVFCRGLVYDFVSQPAEVTVFDPKHQVFRLLDPSRRVQTELEGKAVEAFISRLTDAAAQDPSPYMKFLANPKFKETFNAQTGELALDSDWMTYRLNTHVAKNDEVSRQYGEFSDWYAMLNTMTNPGSFPPAARLQVNRALRRRREIPRQVQLVTIPKRGEKVTLESRHTVRWALSEKDLERVERTNKDLVSFESLELADYLKQLTASRQDTDSKLKRR